MNNAQQQTYKKLLYDNISSVLKYLYKEYKCSIQGDSKNKECYDKN